jgi:hypothetical protein
MYGNTTVGLKSGIPINLQEANGRRCPRRCRLEAVPESMSRMIHSWAEFRIVSSSVIVTYRHRGAFSIPFSEGRTVESTFLYIDCRQPGRHMKRESRESSEIVCNQILSDHDMFFETDVGL